MCRNIKRLRHPDHPPSDAELHDAALQFIRKISGFRVPSQANQAAFERAVQGVTDVSREMFRSLRIREPAGHHHHAEGPLASHAG
ncbi:MAG TPA: DUF2277 domain-containing protein [Gemmatimonadales bacterium]|jgi:hypothetical protein|nr:DUF2277 domain-containing protein [Gemmatimonadales bacterium]